MLMKSSPRGDWFHQMELDPILQNLRKNRYDEQTIERVCKYFMPCVPDTPWANRLPSA